MCFGSFCDLPAGVTRWGQGPGFHPGCPDKRGLSLLHSRSQFPGISDLLVRRTRECNRGRLPPGRWSSTCKARTGVWRLRGCPHGRERRLDLPFLLGTAEGSLPPNSSLHALYMALSQLCWDQQQLPPTALGQRHQRGAAPLLAPRLPEVEGTKRPETLGAGLGHWRSAGPGPTRALSLLQTLGAGSRCAEKP